MKAFPARKSTKVAEQKHDSRNSGEGSERPKLFADTEYTAKLFNETSGRLDIRSVAEIYDLSISELARMINVEAKTAHKTPDSAAIHEGLIPFERMEAPNAIKDGVRSDSDSGLAGGVRVILPKAIAAPPQTTEYQL
jgi:hypothetical protein